MSDELPDTRQADPEPETDTTTGSGRARPAPALDVGHQLASARRAQGVTLDALAEALHVDAGLLEAIERNDFDRFANPTFLRGYVRNFARRLGLDETPLIDSINAQLDPAREVRAVALPGAGRLDGGTVFSRHAGLLLALLTAGTAVIVATALWMIWPETPPQPVPAPNVFAELIDARERDAAEVTIAPGSSRSGGAGIDATDADTSAAETPVISPPTVAPDFPIDAPADADVVVVDQDDAPPATAPAEPSPEARAADALRSGAAAADARVAAAEDRRQSLQIAFSGECWTEIRDATGRAVFFDLGRNGQQHDLRGMPPFQVLLGNAPAVELKYNGTPVALRAHTRRDNTASLVIGQ